MFHRVIETEMAMNSYNILAIRSKKVDIDIKNDGSFMP
jgi:hypothetical protein